MYDLYLFSLEKETWTDKWYY